MNGAFFSELLTTIADRGRNLLGLPATDEAARRSGGVADLCEALLSGRGEASGTALAREVLESYKLLDEAGRLAFFTALAERFGPDAAALAKAVEGWSRDPDEERGAAIHYASEPRRQELFRRLNLAPGGTAALVGMREELLEAPARASANCTRSTADFVHLFSSWFNRGFLVLRRIDWSTPGDRPGKDHPLRGGARDPRLGRPAPPHRSAGPALLRLLPSRARRRAADLRRGRADAATFPARSQPLLARRAHADRRRTSATTAVFYSISNCQQGLAGVSLRQFPHQAGGGGIAPRTAAAHDLRHAVAGARLLPWLRSQAVEALPASTIATSLRGARRSAVAAGRGSSPRRARAAARTARGLLLSRGAHARRPAHRSGRALPSRQRRAAGAHQLARRHVAQGPRGERRDHGQLPL